MATGAAKGDLKSRIDKTLDESTTPPKLDSLGANVASLMNAWPNDRGLYQQLKRLSTFIEKTREEISVLRPDDVKAQFLPRATDELDAIVAATADATNRIMDAVEKIESVTATLKDDRASTLQAAVTAIYEACSFQDITGQRITKVVRTLKVIEERIDRMIAAGSDSAAPMHEVSPATGEAASQAQSQDDIDALFADQAARDQNLLNGPALPGQGVSQAEIDAMLNA